MQPEEQTRVTQLLPKAKEQEKDSSENTAKKQGNTSQQTSKPSAKRSKTSTKRWQTPKNAKELASLANTIATQLLNDEIPLEAAKGFAALGRVVCQLTTAEVLKARYLGRKADLNFPEPKRK